MGVLLEFSKAKLELFVALTVAKKPLQLKKNQLQTIVCGLRSNCRLADNYE